MASDTVTIVLPPDPAPDLVERLSTAFPEATIEAAEAGGSAQSPILSFEGSLAAAVSGASGLGRALADWWGSLEGGVLTLVLIALCLGAAYGVERLVRSLVSPTASPAPSGPADVQRLWRGLSWLAFGLILVGLFAVVARLLGRLVLPADEGVVTLALGILGAVLFTRALGLILEALAAPEAPERRLMGFSDDEAARSLAAGRRLVWILGGTYVVRAFVDAAAPGIEGDLARIVLVLVHAAASIWFFLAVRRPVARLLREPAEAGTENGTTWLDRIACHWSAVFVLLVLLDLMLKVLGILGLLGEGARDGTGPVILVIALAALSIAGLRILRGAVLGEAAGGGWRVGAFTVVEGLIVVGTAIGLLLLWGIDPFDRTAATGLARLIPALVEAGLVVVIGIALWRSVADALARQPAEAEDAQDAGDGMGGEGSRLETVLPIMRGAALGAIGITTGMIALSALGVNITPLIASAGVVGLAIGFGSQKLVSDVISGAFYLYEDAFRIGEYVVTKNGKGTVERISLRSATLRHHNGPLYTIPFSEMGTIQNHSRDYVVMKFSFMVPDETDVEFVRKLIKKAGQELAKDPELEGKLIAPLKSQGAIAIQGRNFEIGCKFTARPGDQFVIRRKAYYILQKTLRDNNIELSAPSVTLAAEEKAFAPSMPPA